MGEMRQISEAAAKDRGERTRTSNGNTRPVEAQNRWAAARGLLRPLF